MTTMNNRVELMDEELDTVNGGFGWDDMVNIGKKVGNKVVTVVKKEVNKIVDTVADGVNTTIEVIRKVNENDQTNTFRGNPINTIKM